MKPKPQKLIVCSLLSLSRQSFMLRPKPEQKRADKTINRGFLLNVLLRPKFIFVNRPQSTRTNQSQSPCEDQNRLDKPKENILHQRFPTFRATLSRKLTALFCRLPLPTLFYRLEATHLGDLMRLLVRPDAVFFSPRRTSLHSPRFSWDAHTNLTTTKSVAACRTENCFSS